MHPAAKKDRWLKKFTNEALPLISRAFNPCRVIIFGSRVKGHASEDSDIDVILISESFGGIKFIKRMSHVLKKVHFPKHIDYLCYTPDEVERVKETSFILQEALEGGIEL